MNSLHIQISGSGQPLILLHGWGWHSGIFTPLLPKLSEKYQLFLIDLPGFGKSPLITSDYTLHAILDALLPHVPEKAAWLGWSMGGLVALQAAISYPKRVTHVMTVASSPKFVAELDWPGTTPQALKKFSDALAINREKTLNEFLTLQLRGCSNRDALLHSLQNIMLPSEPKALLGGLKLLLETDLRSEMKNIHCPSYHLLGQLDTIVPVHIAEKLPLLHEKARCEIIPRGGHLLFLTHPEEFMRWLGTAGIS